MVKYILLQGNIEKGSKLIKEGWIKAKLSKSDLKYLRKKYKKIITVKITLKEQIGTLGKGNIGMFKEC